MITPKYLKPGDKIGFVAPSRSITPEELEKAIEVTESRKLQVLLGKNIYKKRNQFSGTDQERALDMQKFMDDPEIRAIICVRGGYGAIRTMQFLNFKKFVKDPKWIIGYSDITIFHSYVNTNLGIETLHGPMPYSYGKEEKDQESVQKLFDILFGKRLKYNFEAHSLNFKGKAKGMLTGGNLSVLYSLRGTPADVNSEEKILFIEDLDEYLYHIDRMMKNFKYGNKLQKLKGVIIGDMMDMKDNATSFGKSAYEIIADVLSEFKIPVCFGFPAGHGYRNWPLIMGREVIMDVGLNCSLKFLKN